MPPLCALLVLLLATLCAGIQAQSSACPVSAVSIRLQPRSVRPSSFLASPPHTALLNVTRSSVLPRIVVQILNSNGDVDVSASEYLKVVAKGVLQGSTSNDVSLTNPEETVYNGEAHFDSLRVDQVLPSGSVFYLSFTAVVSAVDRPVNGKAALSGPMFLLDAEIELFSVNFLPNCSYITHSDTGVTFVSGHELPETRVALFTSSHKRFVPSATLGLGGNQSITANFITAPPGGTVISGNVALVIQGLAVFKDLKITTSSGQSDFPPLRFVHGTTGLFVDTGPLTSVRLTENARIAFDDESQSYIYSEELPLTAVSGVPFPLIQISLRNTMMVPSSPTTGLVITASIPSGGRARLTGNVVGVVNGIARFDSLAFEQIDHAEARPYVIKFVAGTQGALPLAGTMLVTGFVMVSTARVPAYWIRFSQSASESFFTAQGQAAQIVQGTLQLPVQLELRDSANQIDNATSSVVVDAFQFISTSGETRLASQTFTGGHVTFPSLQLAAAQEPGGIVMLIFRAVTSSYRVGGQTLMSGFLNVTSEVRNFDIRFQSQGASLFSLPDQVSFATVGHALPPVVVQVITSAQVVDTQSDELGITATSDGGAILSGNFIRVSGGIAVFSELSFVSETPGEYRLTFTAGSEGSTPAAGKTIATGVITLVTAVTPDFRPRFQNSSYIAFPGHVMPITLRCCVIPNISVELVDSTHTPATITNQSGVEHPRLRAVASLNSGQSFSPAGGRTTVPIIDGVAVFSGLLVDTAHNPVLTVCIESLLGDQDLDPVNGQCISSGALQSKDAIEPIGALRLLQPNELTLPVELTRQYSSTLLIRGATLRAAIGVMDSRGLLPQPGDTIPALTIGATSTIPLDAAGETRVEVNRSTGIAYFSNLKFSRDFPLGISPIITFSVVRGSNPTPAELAVREVATGLLTVARTGVAEGVEVVAEILAEYATFSFNQWRAAVAKRLNIEDARITLLYSYSGTSAAPASEVTEDTTHRAPDWRGVRLELRFLPPLPTSRDTRTAAEMAKFFVNFMPSCRIGELFLRQAYLKSDDRSCDWYIFDSQMNGVRACIQARQKEGYCACHVPLFQTMGHRCLGLPRMTDLCLDTLINSQAANCKEKEIRSVCQLLQFPDVPRAGLAGTAMFLFLFYPPLIYLYYHGFFHKLGRRDNVKLSTLESNTRDAFDLL
jgi:hypothetical protein